MKTLIAAIALIIWMILTLVLVCTIIGVIVILDSSWPDIGEKLANRVVEEKLSRMRVPNSFQFKINESRVNIRIKINEISRIHCLNLFNSNI